MDKLYKKKAISCKKEKQTSENKIKIAKTMRGGGGSI